MSDPFSQQGSSFGSGAGSAGSESFGFGASGFGGTSGTADPAAAVFGATGASASPAGPMKTMHGPWAPLIVALACAIVGVLLAAFVFFGPLTATQGGYAAWAFVGWLFAGVFAFVAWGVYTNLDKKRRTEGIYIGNYSQVIMGRITIILGLVGVITTALEFALWFSKL